MAGKHRVPLKHQRIPQTIRGLLLPASHLNACTFALKACSKPKKRFPSSAFACSKLLNHRRNREAKCPDLAVSLQGEVKCWYSTDIYSSLWEGRHYTQLPAGIFRKPPAPRHCAAKTIVPQQKSSSEDEPKSPQRPAGQARGARCRGRAPQEGLAPHRAQPQAPMRRARHL